MELRVIEKKSIAHRIIPLTIYIMLLLFAIVYQCLVHVAMSTDTDPLFNPNFVRRQNFVQAALPGWVVMNSDGSPERLIRKPPIRKPPAGVNIMPFEFRVDRKESSSFVLKLLDQFQQNYNGDPSSFRVTLSALSIVGSISGRSENDPVEPVAIAIVHGRSEDPEPFQVPLSISSLPSMTHPENVLLHTFVPSEQSSIVVSAPICNLRLGKTDIPGRTDTGNISVYVLTPSYATCNIDICISGSFYVGWGSSPFPEKEKIASLQRIMSQEQWFDGRYWPLSLTAKERYFNAEFVTGYYADMKRGLMQMFPGKELTRFVRDISCGYRIQLPSVAGKRAVKKLKRSKSKNKRLKKKSKKTRKARKTKRA